MTGKITCWRIKESVINNNVMTTSMNRTNPEKVEHIGTILKGAEKTVIGLAKIKELDLVTSFWMVRNASKSWDDEDEHGLYCKRSVNLGEG